MKKSAAKKRVASKKPALKRPVKKAVKARVVKKVVKKQTTKKPIAKPVKKTKVAPKKSIKKEIKQAVVTKPTLIKKIEKEEPKKRKNFTSLLLSGTGTQKNTNNPGKSVNCKRIYSTAF